MAGSLDGHGRRHQAFATQVLANWSRGAGLWRQSGGAAGANTSRPTAVIAREEVSHGPPANDAGDPGRRRPAPGRHRHHGPRWYHCHRRRLSPTNAPSQPEGRPPFGRCAASQASTRPPSQHFRWSGSILWAWLDLNQRPPPYRLNAVTAVRTVVFAGRTRPSGSKFKCSNSLQLSVFQRARNPADIALITAAHQQYTKPLHRYLPAHTPSTTLPQHPSTTSISTSSPT
jgi:hypothetical protein